MFAPPEDGDVVSREHWKEHAEACELGGLTPAQQPRSAPRSTRCGHRCPPRHFGKARPSMRFRRSRSFFLVLTPVGNLLTPEVRSPPGRFLWAPEPQCRSSTWTTLPSSGSSWSVLRRSGARGSAHVLQHIAPLPLTDSAPCLAAEHQEPEDFHRPVHEGHQQVLPNRPQCVHTSRDCRDYSSRGRL